MKTLEQDIRDTLVAAAGGAAPAGYYEKLADNIAGALEVHDMRGGNMNTGPNGSKSQGDLPPDMLGTSDGSTTAADDDSGLIDIKNMARSTKRRVTQRMSTETDVEESLLASSRPSALRDVVLPEPGREAPLMALGSAVTAAADGSADAAVAVEAHEQKKKGGSWVALAAAAVLLGGGAVGWFALKGGSDADSTARKSGAVAAQDSPRGAVPTEPSDDPPAVAAKTDEPGAIAVDDQDGSDDAKADDTLPVEDPAAAGGDSDVDDGARKVAAAAAGSKASGKKSGGKTDRAKTKVASKKGSGKAAKKDPAKKSEPKAAAKTGGSKEPDFEDLLDNATGGAQTAKGGGAAAEPEKKKVPSKTKLSRTDVKNGMRSVRGRVAACYEQHKVPGTVSVKIKISNTGVVTSASATGKFKGTDTGTCVAKAVTAASFPEFDGPPMSFSYPFLLQ